MRQSTFRICAGFLLIALLALLPIALSRHAVQAQGGFIGATQVPGFFAPALNATTNTAIGSALAVTNPSSNFLMLVQGGPIFCSGAEVIIGQSTIQLAASNTYLIVANCAQQNVYAKVAVTGPGSSGTGVTSPGVPAQILFPIPGLEIPIATVVCNATACGNGGNGTITDNRPLANFPGAGTPLNTSIQANLPTTNVTNGTIIYCSDCTVASSPCTGSSTGAFAMRVNGAWRCQ